MGTLASGSIDLKSLKIAGEPNKYVTYIDATNGIRVHEAGAVNTNFAQINSNGMKIYKGGTSDTNMIASFGDTVQLGIVDTDKYNILINPTGSIKIRQNTNTINLINSYGMQIYSLEDQSYPIADFGSTTTIGKVINPHVNIQSTGVSIYEGLGIRYKIASFGESTIIGKENGSHLTLSSTGFSVYDNAPVEVLSIKPAGEIITRQVTKDYYEELIGSYSTAKSIDKVLTESFTSITSVTLEFTSRYGPKVTRSFTLGTPIGITVYRDSSHTFYTTVNFTVTYNASTQTLTITSGSSSSQSINVELQTIQGSLNVNSPALYIGAEDTSLIKVDYHSLQMISKENKSYFKVEDLRNANGIANITENFSIPAVESNPETPNYSIGYSLKYLSALDNVQSVKLNDVSLSTSQYTISSSSTGFITKITSSANASVGDKLSISYTTQDVLNLQAFTFGNRDETHGYVPGAISVAMGTDIVSDGMYSIAIGEKAAAFGIGSSSQGFQTSSIGSYSHAEGWGSTSKGNYSHAEGSTTQAIGIGSHAEGFQTTASGSWSHTEGYATTASGSYSHAEGRDTTANGYYSHAEGRHTTAGSCSHAEGQYTTASGSYSHAEGYLTEAKGQYSHAQNYSTIASKISQTVIGKYNIEDAATDTADQKALIIGNGTSETRSNALTVDWNGNIISQGMAGIIQMTVCPAGGPGNTPLIPEDNTTVYEPIPGWLICNGAAVSRTTYATLFAVIGTNYGAGDGSTTFNLPDFDGRVPVGAGTGTATDATLHILGTPGGTETVTLTANQSGQRALNISGGAHSHTFYYGGMGSGSRNSLTVYNAGGTGNYGSGGSHTHSVAAADATEAHSNMQPYLVINYIICTGKTS